MSNTEDQATVIELINIASLMSQDIQEYIDAGEESGSDMTASKNLLKDWEEIYQRTGLSWQSKLLDSDDSPDLEISFD